MEQSHNLVWEIYPFPWNPKTMKTVTWGDEALDMYIYRVIRCVRFYSSLQQVNSINWAIWFLYNVYNYLNDATVVNYITALVTCETANQTAYYVSFNQNKANQSHSSNQIHCNKICLTVLFVSQNEQNNIHQQTMVWLHSLLVWNTLQMNKLWTDDFNWNNYKQQNMNSTSKLYADLIIRHIHIFSSSKSLYI